jgi:hypothetical protein
MTNKVIKEAILKTKEPLKVDVNDDGYPDSVASGGQKSKLTGTRYGIRTMKEEAPTVNAGSGNIAGIGVGPKGEPGVSVANQKKHAKNVLRRDPPKSIPLGTFWGQKTFIVPDRMVNEIRMQKRKGKWWTNYLGEHDEISNAIREYANANPHDPIILEGEHYGHIAFCRYGSKKKT